MKRTRIVHDDSTDSPREWDNAGRMVCFHNRYRLGDSHNYDCDNWREQLAFEHNPVLEEHIEYLDREVSDALYHCYSADGGMDYSDVFNRVEPAIRKIREAWIDRALDDGYVILPLYLYDHSGLAMSTGKFNCPWDSGRVGFIYCDKATVQKEWGGDTEAAERCLRAEVEVYSDYIGGYCYGYIAEELIDGEWEHVDSCFGFIGRDPNTNGIKDHLDEDFAACIVWED